MGVDSIMFCDVPKILDEDEVHRIGVRLAVSLGGSSAVWHRPPKDPCLAIASADSNGYDELIPVRDGWTRVGVAMYARYYGPGYERGPIVEILAVAKFLRHVWPGAIVYYGGDSSNDVPVLDEVREHDLWEHLFSEHGRAYFNAFGRYDSPQAMCEHDKIPLNFNMWGGGDQGAYCAACGQHWVYKRDGKIIATKADYKTPDESNAAWADVPKVEVPLWRLKALQQACEDDPRLSPAEIESLIRDVEK